MIENLLKITLIGLMALMLFITLGNSTLRERGGHDERAVIWPTFNGGE